MRMTTDTRYPISRGVIDRPDYGDVLKIVSPKQGIILENRGAQQGAKIIMLLFPDERM